MIIGTVTVTKSMVLAAFVAVSFLLALVSLLVALGFGFPIPGSLAVWIPISQGHYFSSIPAALTLEVAVDWLFWFALMCTVYFLAARRRRRSKAL